jgi:hypothetical protein
MAFDWKSLVPLVSKAAPLVATALGGPGAGAVAGLLASAFGVPAEPDALAKAIQADPTAALRLAELQEQNKAELARIALRHAEIEAETEVKALQEANASLRAEIASSDPYVRRMRPTMGYMICATLAAEVVIGGVATLWVPEAMVAYGAFVTAMAMPMTTALGVLGVYVNGRSKEKMTEQTGEVPQGVVGAIAARLAP